MKESIPEMPDTADTTEEFDYSLYIDGEQRGVDVGDLELWEIEVLEESGNCSIEDINWGRASTMRALAFVLMHRDDPTFTMDDARRLKLKRLGKPDEPAPDPKPAAKRPTRAAKPAAAA